MHWRGWVPRIRIWWPDFIADPGLPDLIFHIGPGPYTHVQGP